MAKVIVQAGTVRSTPLISAGVQNALTKPIDWAQIDWKEMSGDGRPPSERTVQERLDLVNKRLETSDRTREKEGMLHADEVGPEIHDGARRMVSCLDTGNNIKFIRAVTEALPTPRELRETKGLDRESVRQTVMRAADFGAVALRNEVGGDQPQRRDYVENNRLAIELLGKTGSLGGARGLAEIISHPRIYGDGTRRLAETTAWRMIRDNAVYIDGDTRVETANPDVLIMQAQINAARELGQRAARKR